ncbi:MAG: sigma-E factor regulatory protein RseB domain-containing protein, partial [Mycobacteriales bacterium]
TGASSVVVDLQHLPGQGVVVRRAGAGAGTTTATDTTSAATLDTRPLAVLAKHYVVSVAAHMGHCAGRPADVVEARRRGESEVSGRFWLDSQTGLLLRRELYDGTGRAVRSAAFIDVDMSVEQPWSASEDTAPSGTGATMTANQLVDLRRSGWAAPRAVGDGLELFDARKHDGVLHLSYTDGLFAVSVFSQRGRLNAKSVAGWQRKPMGGTEVWTVPGLTQRVVWAEHGWVRTVVADAPDPVVSATVAVFTPAVHDSLTDRVRRGLRRMGSWVNPTR